MKVLFGDKTYELPDDMAVKAEIIFSKGLAVHQLDEFGFPLPPGETTKAITSSDIEKVRGFLGSLADSTLSRSTFKELQDLLERLPK